MATAPARVSQIARRWRAVWLLLTVTGLSASLTAAGPDGDMPSRARAPADADEAITLELINQLESAYLYGGLSVQQVPLVDAETLSRFYAERHFEPLWVSAEGEQGRARQLRAAIEDARAHGLAAYRYHLDAVDRAEALGRWADAELLLGQAFLLQTRHRAFGVVDPAGVDPDWRVRRSGLDELELLRAVARGASPGSVLDRLWPQARGYQQLLDARRKLAADIGEGEPEPPLVPGGPVLSPGMEDARIVAVRRRLGENDGDERYDAGLALEIRALQRSAGLEPDARIGPNTLAVLNRSRRDKIAQIDANLERWRWLPEAFPERHILVNIADYSLLAVDRGEIELAMQVIVGRSYRQTPVFTETMKYLVFNPFWDVPRRLAVEDELPQLKKDPARLARAGFEAALPPGEPMRRVDRIDWQAVSAATPFRLRQRPGAENPLGRIKFMLPNEFAVYLHDTPALGLFDRTERSFSSGCIRVADAMALAAWVLEKQREPWPAGRIDAAVASGQTSTVVLDEPVPVYIVYFTAYVNAADELVLLRDLYGRDGPVIAALGESE